MRGRVLSKLTYANVLSTLCFFLLLGGGAYAAFHLPKDSVKSKNIVNGQVKQADVSHTLTVAGAQTATDAQHATTADSATNATHATSADSAATATTATDATNASNAANADKLGGQVPGYFAPAGSEAWTSVPPNSYQDCAWVNYGSPQARLAYFRDPAGVVHLRGLVVVNDNGSGTCDTNDLVIFTLPVGYRPDREVISAVLSNDKPGRISVETNGDVKIEPDYPLWADAGQWVSLDGITLRCAPSGQDGCP